MAKSIEVIYTHGILRPLASLEAEMTEGQHLTVVLLEHSLDREQYDEDTALRTWCAEQAGGQVPSITEVREMLSRIPDSMADVVIAERRERF